MDFYLNKSFTLATFAKDPKISLVGVPFDSTSTEFPGSRFGPQKIKETLNHLYTVDPKTNICLSENIEDLGNIIIAHGDTDKTIADIEKFIEKFFEQRKTTPIFLGGEHTITYATTKSLAKIHKNIELVVFDAHLDCFDSYMGEKIGHLSYLHKLIKDEIVAKVTVIGARDYTASEMEFAKKHKVQIISVEDCVNAKIKTKNPLYISFDLDVLDFIAAMGTGTPELGGLDTKTAIDLLCKIIAQNKVIGMDFVELNPLVDCARITEYAAAYLLRGALFELLKK